MTKRMGIPPLDITHQGGDKETLRGRLLRLTKREKKEKCPLFERGEMRRKEVNWCPGDFCRQKEGHDLVNFFLRKKWM